jgi:nicotinic acid mononucleotide adenylyltransferase
MLIKEKTYPDYDFFFIIGSDLYNSMHKWSLFDKIKKEINCILVYRQGYVNQVTDLKKLPNVLYCIKNTSSCYLSFSSTEARKLLKKKNLTEKEQDRLKSFFPEEILEYIQKNKLYKKD